jgi:ubiquitin-like-conjugating enzyme ATG3
MEADASQHFDSAASNEEEWVVGGTARTALIAGTALKTGAAIAADDDDDIPEISPIKVDVEDSDNIPDMEGFEADAMQLEQQESRDTAAFKIPTQPLTSTDSPSMQQFIQCRSYDLIITYDKFYQTPRLWLYGYDEQRRPLPTDSIMDDISQDHANKTVTVEQNPHLQLAMVSIHPCKHASVMKRLIDRMNESEDSDQQDPNRDNIRVDQ